MKKLTCLLTLLAGFARSVPAQNFAIDWYVIAPGGGRAAGAGYELNGTVAQPAASTVGGSGYVLEGGFWPGAMSESGMCSLSIVQQPASVTAYAGEMVTFQVGATGTPGPSSYQWQEDRGDNFGFRDIADATNATYFLRLRRDDGYFFFRCRVGNGCTNVFSDPATLTVVPRVIFDNGGPNLSPGHELTTFVQAEDFVLSNNFALTGARFWTLERTNSPPWDGALNYYLYVSPSFRPSTMPFASGSGTNIVRRATGVLTPEFREYEYTFDLAAPVFLNAGTNYWFGLHLSTNWNSDEIYWERTAPGYGFVSVRSQGSPFGPWTVNIVDRHLAFYVTGMPIDFGQVRLGTFPPAVSGGRLTVIWPDLTVAHKLQRATDLSLHNWTDQRIPPEYISGLARVEVPTVGTAGFFRLSGADSSEDCVLIITPDSVSVKAGRSVTVSAAAVPVLGGSFFWNIAAPKVARTSPAPGAVRGNKITVEGLSAGTTTLTLTYALPVPPGGTCTATVEVTVE